MRRRGNELGFGVLRCAKKGICSLEGGLGFGRPKECGMKSEPLIGGGGAKGARKDGKRV